MTIAAAEPEIEFMNFVGGSLVICAGGKTYRFAITDERACYAIASAAENLRRPRSKVGTAVEGEASSS